MVTTQEGAKVQTSDNGIQEANYQPVLKLYCSRWLSSSENYWSQDYGAAAPLPMWYDQINFTSYCKNAWEFYFVKK